MGGPMDYTPGIFKIKMNYYNPEKKEQVHTTLAKQLALYVTMYSPLQMAADLPENYEQKPDAFQFIKDVAVDWDETKILDAEPGDYIVIARKAKNKNDWFLGAITDEQERTISIKPGEFLDNTKSYVLTIYRDGPNAHWQNNPEDYVIEKKVILPGTAQPFDIKLAAGGGCAISCAAVSREDASRLLKSIKDLFKKETNKKLNMSSADILGYAAGALTAFTFLPQVIKTWKSKSAKDISLNMFIIAFVNEIMWLVYGFMLDNWVIILTNAVMLGMSGFMIALKLKYNHQ